VDESSLATGGGDESDGGCVCWIGGGAGADAGAPESEDRDIFLKYGLRDSSAGGLERGV
jgi:hypothetical protein